MFPKFNVDTLGLTKYIFFTGKGGVGKTSSACAIAATLADRGKKIMLISTDPASNLQDVFETELDNKGVVIPAVPNLTVANFEPEAAAAEYRESVVGPYRGKLPDTVIRNMEEQLSGTCTVEIAAFNEFSGFITNQTAAEEFDHIIFDTAPTGHTLRMLQLPSAWTDFIRDSTHGASCLGPLAGLDDKKEMYRHAVENLSDPEKTTLILVAKPEASTLKEAARAAVELDEIGVHNQLLIINGVLEGHSDPLSQEIYTRQQEILTRIPDELTAKRTFQIPLRPYNIIGIEGIRAFLDDSKALKLDPAGSTFEFIFRLKDVVDDLMATEKKVIFTMGKGGVGKTTIAAAIAQELANRGKRVHLTTTDPAAHIGFVIEEGRGVTMSRIDEELELKKYQDEVLDKARETMSGDDLAYIEEDLRSPCTQEIAVFRAFAEIVDQTEADIVVIDTAPTGHTLLLLESTQSYNKEISRTQGDIPESVMKLLPKLKDSAQTEVLIITLPEATPFYEAKRLEEELDRAGIYSKWWIVNSSFYGLEVKDPILKARAQSEIQWLNQIGRQSNGNFALIPWTGKELKGENLQVLLG